MRVCCHCITVVLIFLYADRLQAASSFVRQYTFVTPTSQMQWENTGNHHVCRLSQLIHNYGRAMFVTRAGRATLFELESWQGLSKGTTGRVMAVPPNWRHDLMKKLIAQVKLYAGNHILFLNAEETKNALSALSSGSYLRLIYDIELLGREHITVDVGSVAWQAAFEQYNHCLDRLLPYDFDAISSTVIYFESNSEDLSLTARRELNKIIRYIEAGADIKTILLKGYTDTQGSYHHNRRLAGRRALAVKAYLVDHSVPVELINVEDVFGRYRLTQKGYKGRRVHVQLMH